MTKPALPRLAYSHRKIPRHVFLAEVKRLQTAVGVHYIEIPGDIRGRDLDAALQNLLHQNGIKEHWLYQTEDDFPAYLGIPMPLACLARGIIWDITTDVCEWKNDFSYQFAAAIPAYADLSDVPRIFLVRMLSEIALPMISEDHHHAREAIGRVIDGIATHWQHDNPKLASKMIMAAHEWDFGGRLEKDIIENWAANPDAGGGIFAMSQNVFAIKALFAAEYAIGLPYAVMSYGGSVPAVHCLANPGISPAPKAWNSRKLAIYQQINQILFEELAAAPVYRKMDKMQPAM
jgi:hypothetical protein